MHVLEVSELAIHQTGYLFCLILSIHSHASMQKTDPLRSAIFYRNV